MVSTDEFSHVISEPRVPCDVCSAPTFAVVARRCSACLDVEDGLVKYLQRGGEKARAFVLSCLGAIALCVVLPGCGGAPFAFPRDGGAEPDAGAVGDPAPDAGDSPDSSADAGAEADAPPADAGPSPDAADGAVDGTADSAVVCTTPLQTTPRDLCPGETANRVFPATFIRSAAPGDCADIAGFFTTPPACACAETFTCACLAANGVGGSCATVAGIPWLY